jgi:hypothetical protein
VLLLDQVAHHIDYAYGFGVGTLVGRWRMRVIATWLDLSWPLPFVIACFVVGFAGMGGNLAAAPVTNDEYTASSLSAAFAGLVILVAVAWLAVGGVWNYVLAQRSANSRGRHSKP